VRFKYTTCAAACWEKVKKKSTVHSMTAEGRFVNRLVVEGKVKHLA
jgi:hypothetical protein